MNELKPISSGDDGKEAIKYSYADVTGGELVQKIERSHSMPTIQPTEEAEQRETYRTALHIESTPTPTMGVISKIIDNVIELINEVLEIYDDKMARDSTFTLVEEKIKLLWKNREQVNEHFKGILAYLLVASRNSHYQNYKRNQYESIKAVLDKIRKVYITHPEEKECIKLLGDSGIDLLAPLRNWEDYTIEIKKIDGI